jgi:hypothetical protein
MIHERCQVRDPERQKNSTGKLVSLVAGLIESQVETPMPLSPLAMAHIAMEEVQAINAGSEILTPSEKILRIRMESVGLLKEPSALDLDESAHAKAIVRPSHIPVATAINSDSFDCAILWGRPCDRDGGLAVFLA